MRILLYLGGAAALLIACQAQAQTGLTGGSAHLSTHSSMGFGLTAGQFGDAGTLGNSTSGQSGLETRFASELDTSPLDTAPLRQRSGRVNHSPVRAAQRPSHPAPRGDTYSAPATVK